MSQNSHPRIKPRVRRLLVWLYFGVTGVALSLFASGLLLIGSTPLSMAAASTLPTADLNGVEIPDWSRITFAMLPGIGRSGSYQADPEAIARLGYAPFRSWTEGQSPSQFLSLGDFYDSFQLQDFDLETIGEITGQDFRGTSLSQFGALAFQTLGSLVEAIPSLADFPIREVLPVRDAILASLRPASPIARSVGAVDIDRTIGQFLETSPHLADLEFASLPLDNYTLDSIPNLDKTPLGEFNNWQAVTIQDVPGLEEVPFSEFPNPPAATGSRTGRVDVAFGAAEQKRNRTISGSDVAGFGVPCERGCAHIELSGTSDVEGRQWVSGKYQEVKGGFGVLGAANGGKEPVGRHPFGDAFKVVIWDVSEPEGEASAAMFFRICQRGIPDLGCTPYFLGPVPLTTYREMDGIFLGRSDWGTSHAVASTPTPVAQSEMQAILASPIASEQSGTFSSSHSSNRSSQSNGELTAFLRPTANCSHQYRGVKLDALASALSSIEGNYDSVGLLVCDGSGNCGRGLGQMQLMSYRDDVRSAIAAKPGGEAFLEKLDSGEPITGEQVLTYFPPADQQVLFARDARNLIDVASRQTDPTTGRPFAGNRLIERVAQMHFGGTGAPIDSSATDVHQKLSVKSYGQKASGNYNQSLAAMGCA